MNLFSHNFAQKHRPAKGLKGISLMFLALFLGFGAQAQDASELVGPVNQILRDYQKYSRMTEDEESISEAYKQGYMDLFETENAPVYNDIKSLNNTDESVTALTYAEQLESWYDIGVTSELSLPVGEDAISKPFRDTVANREYVYVLVERRVYGFYKDDKIHRLQDSLYFKISYQESEGKPTELAIKEITKIYREPEREGRFFYAGLHAAPGFSMVNNRDVYYNDYLNINRALGFQLRAELSYYFNDFLGVGAGIGYTHYGSRLNLSRYANSFDTLDIDSEAYLRSAFGEEILERQTLGYLDIPIALKVRIGQPMGAKFYLSAGLQFGVPIVKRLEADGTFTYEGYYAAYNARIYGLETYDFQTDAKVEAAQELEAKTNLSAFASLGALIPLNKSFHVSVAGTFIQGLSNVSPFQNPDFQLSRTVNSYESMMRSAEKANTQLFGFELGLLYRFRLGQ